MSISIFFCFFFKHKTAYEMLISDWSSDVCSSDLTHFAPHYAAPMMRSGVLPVATLRASPSLDSDQTSELLFGEGFALLDLTGGCAWGYCLADHYVGYLAAEALDAPIAPTHRVEMIEAMLHSAPDAASGGPAVLPRGALVMGRSEEHTSALQSLMRIPYAVF